MAGSRQPARRVQSRCKRDPFAFSLGAMLSDPGSMCKHRPGPQIAMGRIWTAAKRRILSPIMHKIMIIRHAEKHQHGARPGG